MKSTFFHVGINRGMAREQAFVEPQVGPCNRIPYVPLPDHYDPDFNNLTYGDPFGRLAKLQPGDIIWFIESGTVDLGDWGYYIVAYFVVEAVYLKKNGAWNREPEADHLSRIVVNAHEKGGDLDYAIVLGDGSKSLLLFESAFRISVGENAYDDIKIALGLPIEKPTRGYWFKKWFSDRATKNLLGRIFENKAERQ